MSTWQIVMVILAGIIFVGVAGMIAWMSGPQYAARRHRENAAGHPAVDINGSHQARSWTSHLLIVL